MKRFYAAFGAVVLLPLAGPCAAGVALAGDSFEDGTTGWRSVGGTISVSDEHWKHEKHSLRWEFSTGATLLREADAAMNAALAGRDDGIKLWLYCERPIRGALRVQVGPWTFPVNLGFTGWPSPVSAASYTLGGYGTGGWSPLGYRAARRRVPDRGSGIRRPTVGRSVSAGGG